MSDDLAGGSPLTVLYVDEQEESVDLVASHLERVSEHLTVHTTTNVQDGLELVAERDVECVVSDYTMPEKSGIEFLEAVRERAPDLPFILYTSRGSEDIASEAISAGVTDYIQKGTTDQYAVLANRIEKAIHQYRSGRELERKSHLLEKAQQIAGVGAWEYDVGADEWWFSEQVNSIFSLPADEEMPLEETFEFYRDDDEPRIRAAIDRAVSDAEEFSLEVEMVDAAGTHKWVRTMGDPLVDAGEVATVRGVIQDVTEQTERERQFETLVANLPGIVYRARVDPDWPFEFLYGECEELTGYTAAELMERDWGSDVIHPNDRQQVYDDVTGGLEDGDSFEITYRIETREGETRWVWERGREIEPDVLDGFIADITDRVDYERDLERYQTIVEASGDGMYALDNSGHLTLLNDSFAEMVGYDEDELLGEHIEMVMTEDDVDQGEELIRSLLVSDENHGMFEMDLVTADGRMIPCENHLVLLPFDEQFRGTAGVLRDITERKEREQKLQRQRDRLEEFASVISHDLRNPLTVAQGYLDIARMEGDEESFELIETSLERMERIIQDVLWLSREGRDIGDTAPVELGTAVADSWRIVSADAEDATLQTPSELGTIEADPDRLTQLLENVFRNALDHGGRDVTVVVRQTETGFVVEDDGPGIPEDVRDRVFERGVTSDEGGTGLGLYIVHDIASAHGWDVILSDADTGGARLEFHTDT